MAEECWDRTRCLEETEHSNTEVMDVLEHSTSQQGPATDYMYLTWWQQLIDLYCMCSWGTTIRDRREEDVVHCTMKILDIVVSVCVCVCKSVYACKSVYMCAHARVYSRVHMQECAYKCACALSVCNVCVP